MAAMWERKKLHKHDEWLCRLSHHFGSFTQLKEVNENGHSIAPQSGLPKA